MIANVSGDITLAAIIVGVPACVIISGAVRGIVSGLREARAIIRQAEADECRCVQQWPGHPCGYCHPREERP